MLDEPTNHLDVPSIQWLEKYLQDYDGTFILVSHDRYFLDRTVNTIAEIANRKITIYTKFFRLCEQKHCVTNCSNSSSTIRRNISKNNKS
ncbi:MAG: hypothetical protein R2847_01170 [Bacteroidia bacterium]